jgi:hypothetical protein
MSRQQHFEHVIEALQATAARIIARGHEHGSILLVLTADGGHVLELEPRAGESVNAAIRRQLRASDAWGYVYVNEAWTTTHVQAFARGEVSRVVDLPRDDRDEEVILVGALRGGQALAYAARIEATPDGRRLGPWQPRSTALQLGDAGVLQHW